MMTISSLKTYVKALYLFIIIILCPFSLWKKNPDNNYQSEGIYFFLPFLQSEQRTGMIFGRNIAILSYLITFKARR